MAWAGGIRLVFRESDSMIDTDCLGALRAIGLAPSQVQQALAETAHEGPESLTRVVEVQREGLSLHDGRGIRAARLLPALRNALAAEADAIAVGDWVLAARNTLGETWVRMRLRPLNQLARRLHDGRDKIERAVIVSNVDTALLVMGLDADFNPRRLERFVALVRMAGVAPLVVLTKSDLCRDVDARRAALRAELPAEVPMLVFNSLQDDVHAALQPWLGLGQTLVVLGSSGAGKSTLTNALLGGEVQDTGGTRGGDGRGRHTTTVRSLHAVPGGGCIIDTPGLRTLRLDGDADGLRVAFDDIATLADGCRFRDCRHVDEPGCAVRDGVAPERLRNWHKLQRELGRDAMSALERKAQQSVWKVRSKAGRQRAEDKRR
jgi:ribosome biogenesis GTPase / thiamine phosphate phosphatase